MKSKITQVEFNKEYGEGLKKAFYYDIWFEGENESWSIGTKKRDPDFLQPGKWLEYEIKDEKRRSIKKAFNPGENKKAQKSAPQKSAPQRDPASPALIRKLDDYPESDLIFIDIETVRAVKELKPGTPMHDAWLYKTRYNNELERKSGETVTPEEYFNEKAALYAVFAKIVAIVAGRIVDGDKLKTKAYSVSKENGWAEAPMLTEFNNDVERVLEKNPQAAFAGWANFGFDQPFLNKRMIINGIKPNVLLDMADKKPWEVPGIDLKNLWQGQSFYPDSLISVATALGLPSPKSNMDGSQVGEAYYAGKIKDIVEYCTGDVLTEANVYRMLAGKPILTLK